MNKYLKVLIPVLVIIGVAVLALHAVKTFVGKPAPGGADHVELAEGAVVPDLKLQRFGGGQTTLSALPSKVVLLNFWASWCAACVSEMPSIVALRKAYAAQGFEVIPMNVDENPEAVIPEFTQRFKMDFPVYVDQGGVNSTIFDVHGIPLTVIIRVRDRKVLMVEGGERDWNSEEMHGRMEGWLKP